MTYIRRSICKGDNVCDAPLQVLLRQEKVPANLHSFDNWVVPAEGVSNECRRH